jgi:hypothetical protein
MTIFFLQIQVLGPVLMLSPTEVQMITSCFIPPDSRHSILRLEGQFRTLVQIDKMLLIDFDHSRENPSGSAEGQVRYGRWLGRNQFAG